MPSSHSGIQPKAALSARAAGSESMAMAPRNSAPSSQAGKGGTAASSVAAAWNSGRLGGGMAVLPGSGVELGGGTSQRLRPGGAAVGRKGRKGMKGREEERREGKVGGGRVGCRGAVDDGN